MKKAKTRIIWGIIIVIIAVILIARIVKKEEPVAPTPDPVVPAQTPFMGDIEPVSYTHLTLMANASKGDFDVMAIQYTYPPVDPYADVAWLLGGEGSWTGYGNDKINEALSKVSLTDDVDQLKELYSIVDLSLIHI